jgi:phospholipid/cholesterol/gamma-HCH transport system substrate-binding protein
METNVNYTTVGIFVISLFTAIVLGIIWLSSGLTIQHDTFYVAYMQESVSGLAVDAPVEYNGVEVGKIKDIELDHNNPRLVELLLSVKQGTPITKNTVATLTVRGLTGIAYLTLKDPGTDLTPLTAPPGQPYPIIKTGPSLYFRLDAALQKFDDNFTKISGSLATLFSEENQSSIRQTLINLREITGAMTSDKVISNISRMTRNISDLTDDLKDNPSMLIRGKQTPPLGPGEQQ